MEKQKKQESLAFALLLDGNGGAKQIGWPEVENWTSDQGILWAHFNYSSKRTGQWFRKYSNLNKLIINSMLAEDSRPRSLVLASGLLIFLRGVNMNPGQEPEDMVSIRIWVDETRVLTTRQRQLLSIDDVKAMFDEGNGPKNSIELMLAINNSLTNRMEEVMDDIDEMVCHLEEEVIDSKSYLLRPIISDVRRQVVLIRRYLAPQREALMRLQIDQTPLINKMYKLSLQEATDRVIRFIEDLDSARDRASIVQEELSSRISEQVDKRMYVLSMVAVIFLPLTFITGLLGINVGGIPGSEYKWAFLIVCSALIIITLGTVLLFRWRKWL